MINVLLVDDHEMVRLGVSSYLVHEKNFCKKYESTASNKHKEVGVPLF